MGTWVVGKELVLPLIVGAGELDVTTEAPFTDVTPVTYYNKAIAWAHANGIVNGMNNTLAPK